AGTIKDMVEDAREVLEEIANEYEIIIVNDGSLDTTAQVADEMHEKYPEVRAVHHNYNVGYGAALKTGFAECKYEVIFYTDGDHQFDIKELKDLMPYIDEYDLVSGYRKNRAYDNEKMRKLSSILYNAFIKLLFGLKYKDLDCAFKLMKRDVIKDSAQFINSGFICAVLFYETERRGKKIKQLPVSHYERKYGVSSSFSFFFILRSIVELFEAVWEMKYREKFYSFRQNILKKEQAKKKKSLYINTIDDEKHNK
ncbi:glycosyltransferase family 2 protein, partial [bacterium]